MYLIVFHLVSFLVSCSGKNLADAPFHFYPAGVFGHPVGREIHQSFVGLAICSYSYRPSAYSIDRTPLHYHGDEMRKWLNVMYMS